MFISWFFIELKDWNHWKKYPRETPNVEVHARGPPKKLSVSTSIFVGEGEYNSFDILDRWYESPAKSCDVYMT